MLFKELLLWNEVARVVFACPRTCLGCSPNGGMCWWGEKRLPDLGLEAQSILTISSKEAEAIAVPFFLIMPQGTEPCKTHSGCSGTSQTLATKPQGRGILTGFPALSDSVILYSTPVPASPAQGIFRKAELVNLWASSQCSCFPSHFHTSLLN